jgi:hypothetical protein
MTSLVQAQAKVEKILTAIDDVLDGKAVTYNGRSVTRESLNILEDSLVFWERRVNSLSGTGRQKIRKVYLAGRTA